MANANGFFWMRGFSDWGQSLLKIYLQQYLLFFYIYVKSQLVKIYFAISISGKLLKIMQPDATSHDYCYGYLGFQLFASWNILISTSSQYVTRLHT